MISNLIKNPTSELLDDYLLSINELTLEYNQARAKHDRAEQWLEDLIDEMLYREKEKYRTKAQARVFQENPEARIKMKDLYRQKRTKEKELDCAWANYYHARNKLVRGERIDVQASVRGRE